MFHSLDFERPRIFVKFLIIPDVVGILSLGILSLILPVWNSVKYGGFCVFLVGLLAVWDILCRGVADVCDCATGGSDKDNLGVVAIPVGTLGALIV